jgi:hypothetical protein
LSGEIENLVFTPTLSASSTDGGQSSGQSFVHMTSAPAMIGYTRKMFRGFVGITRRRRTNVFVRGQLSKILGMFDRPKHCFGTKVFFFFTRRRWIFVHRLRSDKVIRAAVKQRHLAQNNAFYAKKTATNIGGKISAGNGRRTFIVFILTSVGALGFTDALLSSFGCGTF